MYQNAYYQRETNTVHIWDDEKGHIKIPYKKYAYKKDNNGKYKSLYGDILNKITDYDDEDKNLFESDLKPVYRTLIDEYYHTDEISKNHRLLFWDIEVRTEGGVSEPEEANQPITAISYYYNGLYVALILDEQNKLEYIRKNDVEIIPYKTEKQLLSDFLHKWKMINPTIILGWNQDKFDIPYTINRLNKVVGLNNTKALSPLNKIDFDKYNNSYNIVGVSCLDLMRLYKNFNYSEEVSYSLENISQKELGKGKIKYEGTLDNLFKTNPDKFIEYSINDTRLMVEMEAIKQYVPLTQMICHMGHVPYEDIYMPSILLDGAALTYMKRNNIVAPNKRHFEKYKLQNNLTIGQDKVYLAKPIESDCTPLQGTLTFKKPGTTIKIQMEYDRYIDNYFILKSPIPKEIEKDWELKVTLPGAYVMDPIPGIKKLLYDLDKQSMYPMIIITLNISPETKRGRIKHFNNEDFVRNKYKIYEFILTDGSTHSMDTNEFKEWVKNKNYSISANGIMYDLNTPGLIPTILKLWFDNRVEYKNQMKIEKGKGNKEKTEYFHQRQLTTKILLNSFYGVLALNSFRFFDIDNAESVTATGQHIIKFSAKAGNLIYNMLLETNKMSYELYTDTDSCLSITELQTNKFGRITIEELYNNCKKYNDEFIDITNRHFLFPTDIKLPYYNEQLKQINNGLIQYIEKHKVKKKIFRIKLKNNKFVEVTSDHCLMVLRGDSLIKCKPEELLSTDKFICLKNLDLDNEIVELEFAEDLGFIDEYVYDIGMVDTPHTFFGNDILVHNSTFFSTIPFLEQKGLKFENTSFDDMINLTMEYAKQVQTFINESYSEYVKQYLNIQSGKHTFKIKQENVAYTGFWMDAKKRYCQCIISEEGVRMTELNTKSQDRIYNKEGIFLGKLDVKGIETRRSDFPKSYKEFMVELLKKILALYDKKDIDDFIIEFRQKSNLDDDITEVLSPSSVKDIEKYDYNRPLFYIQKGTPIHVKASLCYNDLLDYYKINNIGKIRNWDKVKYGYLKENPLKLDVLAIKGNGDNPKEILDFFNKYIDYDHIFESKIQDKLQNFYDCLKWGLLPNKNEKKLNKLFDF